MPLPLIHLCVMALSGAGFAIAYTIYSHKRVKKPLVCPMRTSCSFVTQSDHSRFLGFPVENLGMLYYGATLLLHVLAIWFPRAFFGVGEWALFGLSVGAFLFSVYLMSVQAFILKQWCTWCIGSALLSTGIFVFGIVAIF